jgi:hypothetical protein
MEETINAFFHEFQSPIGTVNLYRFFCFVNHSKLFNSSFDHSHALQIFLKAARSDDDDADLTPRDFRLALEAIAERYYNRPGTLSMLINEISLRREGLFDLDHMSEISDLIYDIQVTRAMYNYGNALRALFSHYAVRSDGKPGPEEVTWDMAMKQNFVVSGRSLYRLCRATQIVPGVVVPAELLELTRGLAVSRAGDKRKAEVHRYFEDEKMVGADDTQSLRTAVYGAFLPGEPRYDFPSFVEVLLTLALCSPPPVHLEPIEERLQRIHQVLGGFLGLPEDGMDESWVFHNAFREEHDDVDDLPQKDWDASRIFEEMDDDLDELPPVPPPKLPGPKPDEKLAPPRPTIEEIQEKAAAEAMKRKKKKKKKKGDDADKSVVAWNKIQYVGKHPEPKEPTIPDEYNRERRGEQWTAFELKLHQQRAAREGLPESIAGRALRTSLIDEPLLSPPSDIPEVATLVETAAASRRLRDYDIAIRLLNRARHLWAVRAANPIGGNKLSPSPPPMPKQDSGRPRRNSAGSSVESAGSSPRGSDIEPDDLTTSRSSLRNSRFREALHEQVADEDPDGAVAEALSGFCGNSKDRSYDPEVDFQQLCDDDDSGLLDNLKDEVNLFFWSELASLHTAIRQDELAVRLLWRGKRNADGLPQNHPDKATVWAGLGRVAFHHDEFDLAARSFLRVRFIREATIGGDTVESATSYNNVAVSLMAISRDREAVAYLQLSTALFRHLLGEQHPRTLTSERNLSKAKSGNMSTKLEVPHIFYIPHRDTVGITKKKKKKKGGKKKK